MDELFKLPEEHKAGDYYGFVFIVNDPKNQKAYMGKATIIGEDESFILNPIINHQELKERIDINMHDFVFSILTLAKTELALDYMYDKYLYGNGCLESPHWYNSEGSAFLDINDQLEKIN